MKCLICGLEFKDAWHLSGHIRHTHKMLSKDYYDAYLKEEKESMCLICCSPTRYVSITAGYNSICGKCVLVSLDSYIAVYGEEEGTNRYNERVKKLSVKNKGINKGEKNGNYKAPKKKGFCEHCGNSVERTAKYTAKMYFCDNECKRQWLKLNPPKIDSTRMIKAFQEKYGIDNPIRLLGATENLSKIFTKTNEQFLIDLKNINAQVTPIEVYINDSTKILFKCNKCFNEWHTKPNTILNGGGCPKCNMSKGENKINQFLLENAISFIPQKSFEGCVYIHKLKFDFYLSTYNVCIEFDGEQHHKEGTFRYNKTQEESRKAFEIQQIKDNIKTQYCKDNNIPLIRIPYWDIKNIETILTKELGL